MENGSRIIVELLNVVLLVCWIHVFLPGRSDNNTTKECLKSTNRSWWSRRRQPTGRSHNSDSHTSAECHRISSTTTVRYRWVTKSKLNAKLFIDQRVSVVLPLFPLRWRANEFRCNAFYPSRKFEPFPIRLRSSHRSILLARFDGVCSFDTAKVKKMKEMIFDAQRKRRKKILVGRRDNVPTWKRAM